MKKLLMCLLGITALVKAECGEHCSTVPEDQSLLKSLVTDLKDGKEVTLDAVCETLSSDIKAASEEIAVLGCTIAIYKNKKMHDKKAWKSIIKKFTSWLKSNDDDEALCKLAQAIYDCGREENGIHFKLNVSFDNGDCGDECSMRCSCIKRDEGVCICSVMGCSDCCDGQEETDLVIV